MNLTEALDYLASNCPTVFAPIASELANLKKDKEAFEPRLKEMQELIDFLILKGGM